MHRDNLLLFLAFGSCMAPAHAEISDFSRVLSSVTLSFEGDGTDRAVLVENSASGADLYIYLALDPNREAPSKPNLIKASAAWSGVMWGTRPSLDVSDKGSLLIKSGNEGIGRGRWSQTLTVAYRNKEFIVAGFTREEHDTLDLKAGGSCDINFLAGKGKRNGSSISIRTPAPRLSDWSDEKLPQSCIF